LGLGARSTNFVISTGFSKDFGAGKSKYAKALIFATQKRSGVEISEVYEMENERHMPNFRLPKNSKKRHTPPGSQRLETLK